MHDRYHKKLNVGDWVKVVQRSVKYNIHINNVGYVGEVEEVGDDVVQIACLNGSMGAVDSNCVTKISEPTRWEKARLREEY